MYVNIYGKKKGCLAGAAQSIVATPLDSLKVRFEVNDLLEGKHRSMYQFAKSTFKELGIASAYRGFTLTLLRVRSQTFDIHYKIELTLCS